MENQLAESGAETVATRDDYFPELLTYQDVGRGQMDVQIMFFCVTAVMLLLGVAYGSSWGFMGVVSAPFMAAVVNEYRKHHPPNRYADALDDDEYGRELLKQAGIIRYNKRRLLFRRPCTPGSRREAFRLAKERRQWLRSWEQLRDRARKLDKHQRERLDQLGHPMLT